MPNTAKDIVLLKEKQKCMYFVQASCSKESFLINQRANGGNPGIDTRVIERHPHRMVDICGIDNHVITSIPIVTAGAVGRSQRGCHSYNTPVRISSAARKVDSFLMSIGIFCQQWQQQVDSHARGLQRIQTVDGYVFPLSIQDGLPYLGMRPYTDVEYKSTPHVILTSNVDWDPRLLDFDIDYNNNCYDAILDNMNYSELFGA
jgi:hypothetical protein